MRKILMLYFYVVLFNSLLFIQKNSWTRSPGHFIHSLELIFLSLSEVKDGYLFFFFFFRINKNLLKTQQEQKESTRNPQREPTQATAYKETKETRHELTTKRHKKTIPKPN